MGIYFIDTFYVASKMFHYFNIELHFIINSYLHFIINSYMRKIFQQNNTEVLFLMLSTIILYNLSINNNTFY